MKKIIALLSALTIFTALSGCGSEGGSSSEVVETTEVTTKNYYDELKEKEQSEWEEFQRKNQTEATTEETTPQQNTTAMVDAISEDAKKAASTATPENLQNSLDILRDLSGKFYTSNETMETVMYNAQLLYYYYEGTNMMYEQAGFYAFAAVKYVYRGVDDVDSSDTADNLAKFAAALLQCKDIVTDNNISNVEPTASPTEATTEPPTEKITTYSAGTYKVGSDIPAGEYCIYCVSDIGGYYSVNEDSKGDSIIGNDNFDYNAFVTIYDGQYLELSRAMAVPVSAIDGVSYKIDTSKTGTFRVGIDIPAGEYKLINDSELGGYYCVYNNSNPDADIVTNDNFEGQTYITVSDGQYLLLSRCKIEQ